VRQGWIEERTATINRLRAVLTEFGVVLPNRVQCVRRGAHAAAEALPALARQAVADLRAHLGALDERITSYGRELQTQTLCRLTYGNRARGFHQGQSARSLANRPVIVTQSFLCSSALQFRGSPYGLLGGRITSAISLEGRASFSHSGRASVSRFRSPSVPTA
jgi:hypothetical protein